MATTEYNPENDRRNRSQDKLATLVKTRTETLSRYTELANHRPFVQNQEITESLQEFCQVLIDYTASAHFQLYRYITDKLERRTAVLKLADSVYPHIAQTTDAILRFNDKYDGADLLTSEKNLLKLLDEDLSKLGETLAERIQLEDKVIGALTGQLH